MGSCEALFPFTLIAQFNENFVLKQNIQKLLNLFILFLRGFFRVLYILTYCLFNIYIFSTVSIQLLCLSHITGIAFGSSVFIALDHYK